MVEIRARLGFASTYRDLADPGDAAHRRSRQHAAASGVRPVAADDAPLCRASRGRFTVAAVLPAGYLPSGRGPVAAMQGAGRVGPSAVVTRLVPGARFVWRHRLDRPARRSLPWARQKQSYVETGEHGSNDEMFESPTARVRQRGAEVQPQVRRRGNGIDRAPRGTPKLQPPSVGCGAIPPRGGEQTFSLKDPVAPAMEPLRAPLCDGRQGASAPRFGRGHRSVGAGLNTATEEKRCTR